MKHALARIIAVSISIAFAYLSWKVVPDLKPSAIHPIASTMASVAGVLFGFVMASLTILTSANGNRLIENTKKTKYFEKLLRKLHISMLLLIIVCVNFLVALFIPDTVTITIMVSFKLISLVLVFGVFLFSLALFNFISVWHDFSQFAKNM